MRTPPKLAVSVMPTEDWRVAHAPLIADGTIDALEWSVDFQFGIDLPGWVTRLLSEFEERGALIAHGVEGSWMSARKSRAHDRWKRDLERAIKARRYAHLTEHYGFIRCAGFLEGTPLPMPGSTTAKALLLEAFDALEAVSGVPVGLENLGFAFGSADAFEQAALFREVLTGPDRFLLLDLHNLYCAIQNYRIAPLELLRAYPLERAREIHLAGGMISELASGPFRRDTHDEDLPEGVFDLLEEALPRCPELAWVTVERTGRSLFSEAERDRHARDLRRLKQRLVHGPEKAPRDPRIDPPSRSRAAPPLREDSPEILADLQASLIRALREGRPLSNEHAPYASWFEAHEGSAREMARRMAAQWFVEERAPKNSDGPSDPEAPCALSAPSEMTQPSEMTRPSESRELSVAGPPDMLALVLERTHAPLRLMRLPIPLPGRGQVTLRMTASGICGTDLHACEGRFPVPMPIVLGHECVGIVEQIGAEVDPSLLGARVGLPWIQSTCGACAPCQRGLSYRCDNPRTWVENGGGFSEFVVAESAGCVRLPSGVPDALLAPLFCAGHTVMSAYRSASPAPSDVVAVVGLGGLGHLAVQLAKGFGHRVLALTGTDDKRRDALALGADDAWCIGGGDDLGERLRDAGGVDLVLGTSNHAPTTFQTLRGLRPGGRLVLTALSDELVPVHPTSLIARELRIIGAVQGTRAELDETLALAARGVLRPWVECHPLVLGERARERHARGHTRYRAVLLGAGS